jgi:uncharacterized protein (TIGR03000 family)
MFTRTVCSIVAALLWLSAARAQAPTGTTARLKVLLPHKYAVVELEGKVTRMSGTERTFVTPPLEAGAKYSYALRATWLGPDGKPVVREKKVSVTAGQEAVVDLREGGAVAARPPLDVPYVATPPNVVETMLRTSGVRPSDVVYDLGCGDGRVVIAAVQQFGAKKGIGIDIDPERVQQSMFNAAVEGVAGRTEFRVGNVLKLDKLTDATIVTLYLLPEINLKVRPLLQSLPPGTVIVSHDFDMGDWQPDRTERVRDPGGTMHTVFVWTIKAR